jgi:hypothetical protein
MTHGSEVVPAMLEAEEIGGSKRSTPVIETP